MIVRARLDEKGMLWWYCEGCKTTHIVPVEGDNRWTWNGNPENPTLVPSVLIRTGHFVPKQPQPPDCWYCKRAAERGRQTFCSVCHVNINDGLVTFHADCTHELANSRHWLRELPTGHGTG